MSDLDELRQARAAGHAELAHNDLAALLQQPAFLRWLERFFVTTKVASSSLAPTADQSLVVDGMREAGLAVVRECIRVNPLAIAKVVEGAMVRMSSEAIDDAKAAQAS